MYEVCDFSAYKVLFHLEKFLFPFRLFIKNGELRARRVRVHIISV